jgi:hypothetical protein
MAYEHRAACFSAGTKGGDHIVMPLTPSAQIDELSRLLRESEQRRQAAEVKLADCDRQLGTARAAAGVLCEFITCP